LEYNLEPVHSGVDCLFDFYRHYQTNDLRKGEKHEEYSNGIFFNGIGIYMPFLPQD
jgi:hypothetical protein